MKNMPYGVLTIIDEWLIDSSNKPKPKYTQLTKKERGKLRYDRQQARIKDERAFLVRTRTSDIAPVRITDGISVKSKPQTFEYVPKKAGPLELLLNALIKSREEESK